MQSAPLTLPPSVFLTDNARSAGNATAGTRPEAGKGVLAGAGAETAHEFESLIIGQLLKTMRSASDDGGMFPGDKSDTYGGMFDMYFGEYLAKNGGLGLADFVQQGIRQAGTE